MAGHRGQGGSAASVAFYETLVERSTAALVTVEPAGTIRFASPAAGRLLGLDRRELIGRNLAVLCDGDEGSRLLLYFDQVATGPAERSAYIAVDVRHPDQSLRRIEVTGVSLVSDAFVRGLALLLVDVTGRARLEEQLSQLSTTDPLTGLVNRRGLEHTLAEGLAMLDRGELAELAVCFLDLDGFKVVNDALGHATGDAVLVEVAARLDDAVRRHDVVSRSGGDEFVLVLRDPGELEAIMQRIFDAMAEPVDVQGAPLKIGASIGLASTTGGTSAAELLRRADAAMYRAKAAGKGRWSRYDLELDQWLTARRTELQDLQTHYQSLRRTNEALQQALHTDALTRLPNRLQVELDFERAVGDVVDEGATFAVAFIDVDQFGQYNKRFGQDVGDAVLQAVAATLRAACRDVDTVYRLGGEEFVALLPGATLEEAARIADRMRRRVESQAHTAAGCDEPITVSIGIARLDGRSPGGYKAVINAADAAMRGAKSSGKNRVILATPDEPEQRRLSSHDPQR